MALSDVLPFTWEQEDGQACVGGVALRDIAARFGTPAYVFDVEHLERRLDAFEDAFADIGFPVYATKAFLCTALAEMLASRRWWADVVSVGEAEIARRGGIPASRLLLHGNLKSDAELQMAVSGAVGVIVIDSLGELDRLACMAQEAGRQVDVMIRLNETVGLVTNRKVLTSGDHSKFGLDREMTAEAMARVAANPALRLRGLHLHAGSHITDADLYSRILLRLVAAVESNREAFVDDVVLLDVGGGMASSYLRDDLCLAPAQVGASLRSTLLAERVEERIGPVQVMVEPGRALVANAAVLLYTVGVRKPLPGGGELLAVDGGLTDNPRPALYGSRYEVMVDGRSKPTEMQGFRVFGRMCETDVLLEEVMLPAEVGPGDLVFMPTAGAYTFTMSSRYNALPRPPVLFVRDGVVHEVVRRETLDEILAAHSTLSEAAPVVM